MKGAHTLSAGGPTSKLNRRRPRRPRVVQLRLPHIRPDEDDWHLDEHTRQVGRAGVARSRAVLAGCRGTSRRGD